MPDHNLLFLPGASGDANFWRGVCCELPACWPKTLLSWPGLGQQDPDPDVHGMADLLRLAEKALTQPSVVVAQSMGGVIAIQLALRHPDLVTHLVLTATSGGIDTTRFGAEDWRPDYLRLHPKTAQWITTEHCDITEAIPTLRMPTLLLWGACDRISPVAVGRHLANIMQRAELCVIPDGEHPMAFLMPEHIAPHIARFLGATDEDYQR